MTHPYIRNLSLMPSSQVKLDFSIDIVLYLWFLKHNASMSPALWQTLDGNWSRRQRYHVGVDISGRVGEILGRVGEIFWTRRRNPWTRRRNILDTSAAFWSSRRHKIGRLVKDTTSSFRRNVFSRCCLYQSRSNGMRYIDK